MLTTYQMGCYIALDTNSFRLVSNGQQWPFETSDVTWSQKSTLVCTLNPELMRGSIITDVQIYQGHNLLRICIYSNNFFTFPS